MWGFTGRGTHMLFGMGTKQNWQQRARPWNLYCCWWPNTSQPISLPLSAQNAHMSNRDSKFFPTTLKSCRCKWTNFSEGAMRVLRKTLPGLWNVPCLCTRCRLAGRSLQPSCQPLLHLMQMLLLTVRWHGHLVLPLCAWWPCLPCLQWCINNE